MLLLIAFVLPTIVCGQAAIQHSTYQLEHTFKMNGQLSQLRVDGFQTRGVQKVYDFANYIELISDKSLDKELREQAREMALKLFNSSDNVVLDNTALTVKGDEEFTENKVADYLDVIMNSKYDKVIAKLDTISDLTQPLEMTLNGNYKGQMVVELGFEVVEKGKERSLAPAYTRTVELILKKVEKSFGNEKMEIWEILIGDFR
jgi:hypothetical protein